MMGLSTDTEVLKIIKEQPGLTSHKIRKLLDFTRGKIDGSLNRLEERKEIELQLVLHNGKMAKEAYPYGSAQVKKPEIIIENEMLVSPDEWKKSLRLYALDRSTIGIAPSDIPQWRSKSIVVEAIQPVESPEGIIIKLPPKLASFYSILNSDFELAILDNRVLVVFKTKIPIMAKSREEREELEQIPNVKRRTRETTSQVKFQFVFSGFVARSTQFAGNYPIITVPVSGQTTIIGANGQTGSTRTPNENAAVYKFNLTARSISTNANQDDAVISAGITP